MLTFLVSVSDLFYFALQFWQLETYSLDETLHFCVTAVQG